MKKMTFQISEKKYQEILNGERNSVSRFVYPTNVTRYVYKKNILFALAEHIYSTFAKNRVRQAGLAMPIIEGVSPAFC